jgi:hypothetical protein
MGHWMNVGYALGLGHATYLVQTRWWHSMSCKLIEVSIRTYLNHRVFTENTFLPELFVLYAMDRRVHKDLVYFVFYRTTLELGLHGSIVNECTVLPTNFHHATAIGRCICWWITLLKSRWHYWIRQNVGSQRWTWCRLHMYQLWNRESQIFDKLLPVA